MAWLKSRCPALVTWSPALYLDLLPRASRNLIGPGRNRCLRWKAGQCLLVIAASHGGTLVVSVGWSSSQGAYETDECPYSFMR